MTLYSRDGTPSRKENRAASGKRARNQWNFERAMIPPNQKRVLGSRRSKGSSVTPFKLPEV